MAVPVTTAPSLDARLTEEPAVPWHELTPEQWTELASKPWFDLLLTDMLELLEDARRVAR